MGRPLSKKYFGNRNIGTTGTADDHIGGEGVASISNGTVGSININDTYKTFPALLVAAPELPGGVTSLTQVTWEIESISIGGTNTGYTNSQTGSAATLTGLNGYISGPTFTINTNGTGNVSAINITNRGSWTSIDGTGITTGYSINGAGGTNAMATVKFRVKSIAITEKGSGYIALPNLSWSQVNGGTMPSTQTPALTTDSGGFQTGTGGVNVSTNQENAIIAYAYIGGNREVVDIVKQESSRRYKVLGADGTNRSAKLKNGQASATSEMDVTATDSSGKTYYVIKLTAHKALLKQYGSSGWEFADGTAVRWTFNSATLNTTVQVANA